ncbi:DUF4083 domain-containing protein [Halalkalibacter akibai]|uniref:DUF4083 domain-containing protein n=1 Tax=Halalkalibacter akibai (strain ATCC 43226 / DSM 21942 / CIP 109018 / JCM 9157 / 1139) TaxID=1236973 RepID=W4QXG9_HALA3|nr:DUF4083 domain-containing protein [Halalkalibacter akibai]GAE36009.1 hypothetical protein JCM9157_3153 [Halalkalibacter akibai JCM 9157]
MEVHWGSIIYQLLSFGLIILFVVSFTLFIRRLLLNSKEKNSQLKEIGNKLDKIIDQIENDKK